MYRIFYYYRELKIIMLVCVENIYKNHTRYYYFTAIASTSSRTSFGSLATSTHDLAG